VIDLLRSQLWQQAPLEPLPDRQQLVAIVLATSMLALVVELVRRRKLREEYAWVWLAVALVLLALALQDSYLITLSRWIGSATSTSTLFFGALVFLLLLSLQFSVQLSRLTLRQRTTAQRLALLEQELERLQRQHERSHNGEQVNNGVASLRQPPAVATPADRLAKDEPA
jgi:hypothetical protein